VVLLDTAFAVETSAREALRLLGEKLAARHSVVVLVGPAPAHPEDAMFKGIHGALAVDDPLEDWPLALTAARRGAAHFSAAVASHLPATDYKFDEHGHKKSLSAREAEIFALVRRGHSPRSIAARLGRSVKTVEAHVQRIKTKMDCPSLAELRAIA
jgi:two-component system, NarL family, response regulator FusR